MKKALVTGAGGFTGRYVIAALRSRGYRVVGLSSKPTQADETIACELTDAAAVREVVRSVAPDFVLHLAALAFVAHADEQAFYRVNLFGTQNLLQALAELDTPVQKVLLASSANVYGSPELEVLDESLCPAPVNHYAMSKLAMEHMAHTWFDRLPIVIVRPFNYTGMGQDEKFLVPKIVSHFRRGAKVIELGNIDVERDFSDVRTVADVYSRLLECVAAGGTFNVCSGVVWSLKDVLAMMAEIAGYEIEVRVNPDFVRANELKRLQGDASKLEGVLGALDNIPLQETLRWMYMESRG